MLGTLDTGNAAWVLVSAALVLFMTPGLAFFYGGMARGKNVLNMLMMNFWCLLIVPIVWVIAGFSLAYSGAGSVIGNFDFPVYCVAAAPPPSRGNRRQRTFGTPRA